MKEVKEAQDLLYSIMKSYKLSDVAARICSLLYLSPEPLSLEELAEETQYSLATISNTVRFLNNFFLIQKVKKPGTKRVYVTGNRNPIEMMEQKTQLAIQTEVKPIKEKYPALIKKLEGKPKYKPQLQLMKEQYQQTLQLEKVLQDLQKSIEKVKKTM